MFLMTAHESNHNQRFLGGIKLAVKSIAIKTQALFAFPVLKKK